MLCLPKRGHSDPNGRYGDQPGASTSFRSHLVDKIACNNIQKYTENSLDNISYRKKCNKHMRSLGNR